MRVRVAAFLTLRLALLIHLAVRAARASLKAPPPPGRDELAEKAIRTRKTFHIAVIWGLGKRMGRQGEEQGESVQVQSWGVYSCLHIATTVTCVPFPSFAVSKGEEVGNR